MVFGKPLVLPGHFLDGEEAQIDKMRKKFELLTEGLPLRLQPPHEEVPLPPDVQWVFVRIDSHKRLLTPLYTGPYRVLSRTRQTVCLQMGDKVDVVAVQCLKPFQGSSSPVPAAPTCQGCPTRLTALGGSPVASLSSLPCPL